MLRNNPTPTTSEYEQGERVSDLEKRYRDLLACHLSFTMARGIPSPDQLDLSMPLLEGLYAHDMKATDGSDLRTYGCLEGLPEARKLMAIMLDDIPENTFVGGNSSLSIMYNILDFYWCFGVLGGAPWSSQGQLKWLCPCPGYDRHFAITQAFGIEMIPVAMTSQGPDMDEVERLVRNDASVKGIWCVPQYSNPSGITYSHEVVSRLAHMVCAASDFRIFWDNAYSIHHHFNKGYKSERVFDIAQAAQKAECANRPLKFSSTSKVTFPGAGIAAVAASPENLVDIRRHLSAKTIGYDKLNQLRHVRFLKNEESLLHHMQKHAEIIRPKFQLVDEILTSHQTELAGCQWSHPQGGYFISFDAPAHSASHIVALADAAGLRLTDAGATFPYHKDPLDSNIRLAPTALTLSELKEAISAFVVCVKVAIAQRPSHTGNEDELYTHNDQINKKESTCKPSAQE